MSKARAARRNGGRAAAWLAALLVCAGAARADEICGPELDVGALASAQLGGGDDSGIGGTGIYGTLTGFGSLCVNGLRVHYAPDVPVEHNGEPADASHLALGQVLWIEARERGGRLEAERIAIHSALVGPVERVDLARREVEVLGRRVRIPEQAVLVTGGSADLSELRPGVGVDVSGLPRADGVVVASRVVALDPAARTERVGPPLGDLLERARSLVRLSIEGYVSERVAATRFRVNGVEVDTTAIRDAGRIARPDRRVRAVGRLTRDGRLRVERPPPRPEVERRPPAPVERPAPPPRIEPAPPERAPRPRPPLPPERPERIDRPERLERLDRAERIDDAPSR